MAEVSVEGVELRLAADSNPNAASWLRPRYSDTCALQRGDLVRFPPGPEGAHKVTNRSDAPGEDTDVPELARAGRLGLPDSDKIEISSGNEPDELIFKRGTAVPWSEGEEGWHLPS